MVQGGRKLPGGHMEKGRGKVEADVTLCLVCHMNAGCSDISTQARIFAVSSRTRRVKVCAGEVSSPCISPALQKDEESIIMQFRVNTVYSSREGGRRSLGW